TPTGAPAVEPPQYTRVRDARSIAACVAARVFWQAGHSFIIERSINANNELWQERRDKNRAQFWQVWPIRRDKISDTLPSAPGPGQAAAQLRPSGDSSVAARR